MKILLLDAYDAASHRYWRAAITDMLKDIEGDSIQWTELVLPPRYFSWRIRGNSLSWGKGEYDVLQSESLDKDFDLVIATSMVDLSALRGFIPKLGLIPTLVYFHENQFSYPVGHNKQPAVEPQIVNLYAALCADKVVFNSEFNQQTFLKGAESLLKKLPDEIPKGLVQELSEKSSVLPVPIVEVQDQGDLNNTFIVKDTSNNQASLKQAPLKIVWNHRWEYDKGPERLLAFVKEVIAQDLIIELNIVGERFRNSPKAFDEIELLLKNNPQQQLKQFGFIESYQKYLKLLEESDFVLSTSLHDFQGLSVLQAVAKGCLPLVPNRMAYPQWFSSEVCYPEADSEVQEAKNAVQHLKEYNWSNVRIDIESLSPHVLTPMYLKVFAATIAKSTIS